MLPCLKVTDHSSKKSFTSTKNVAICWLCFFHNLAFAVNTCEENIYVSVIESLCSQKDPVHVKIDFCSSPTDPSLVDYVCSKYVLFLNCF